MSGFALTDEAGTQVASARRFHADEHRGKISGVMLFR
ncbi:hypothetical protein EPYR_00725 [Erwinia pyrifoliae DSM 12163]|nr:hypothetical protein EPYR_00725 [Erwinia pyrifoliae DSM 12163]